ncbi:hypothetical protein EZV62_008717 [Acer yangbiense]|uniref:glycerophosphodiester phosphodiesterase n=1 Tax=Acer yangbiense TaxID=1000413 RepID=A0A5C7IEQ3_9ROSI|nr:hypothetical protein EZV62_008717 [Acer yangbiense]
MGKVTSLVMLAGDPPFVVARGGFSGLLPDSSFAAYSLAMILGVPDVIVWCDVQLTKDAIGICFPDIKLQNASNIGDVYQNKDKVYLVNGAPTRGWFPIDYTFNDLANVILTQGVYSRTNKFDGNLYTILTAEDMFTQVKPPGLWLNIQHDAFYTQHNLSMRSYILSVSRRVVVSYISSPEVGFLGSIAARFNPNITKLVFRFLKQTEIEPTTNQTYGTLLGNLTFIKTFASGILVPKDYIWPVDASQYLLPHTSLVADAHKEGLEVFASDFSNDVPYSFNFSYDPLAEYLHFIDNGDFSVDGVLSDFPITPSAARDCFSHIGRNASNQVDLKVISKNGASGDFPSCTNLAYQQAILDGADVIDCPVQMSKDGTPFCFSSINLIDSTTASQSSYSNYAMTIPEIMEASGIFAFNLTWDEIQTLTLLLFTWHAIISNPFTRYRLFRNPKFKNAGTFLKLSDFLTLAKNSITLNGVLVSIENAAYLAEKQGLGVTDAVMKALKDGGYDNQTDLKVMIQSTNSSVLMKFKDNNKYEIVYKIEELIRDASNASVEDIKKFADSVVIDKESVLPLNAAFLTKLTDVVAKLQAFKLPVYVELFSNEFISQAWDFFSDATVEINSFVFGTGINGVITGFPETAARYRSKLAVSYNIFFLVSFSNIASKPSIHLPFGLLKYDSCENRCLRKDLPTTPNYMSPVQPGSLIQLVTPQYLPPAEAPNPIFTVSDIVEPPLPPVTDKTPSSSGGGSATPPTPSRNGQPRLVGCIFLSSMAMLLAALLLYVHSSSLMYFGNHKFLRGDPPLVVARGGFSGLLPDSSLEAYTLAVMLSVPDVMVWCDVQLTKDAIGICFPDVKLQNASNIAEVYKGKDNAYLVNGIPTQGRFPIDYTFKDLANVSLTQGVYSRTNKFDGNVYAILTVEDVFTQVKPPGLWLNIQHDAFYAQHNLSMRSYILSVSKSVVVSYISSPEVNFLRGIAARFNPKITKLVFRFQQQTETEPTTNQTYGSLLGNLTFIKTFASGILVPKDYIWPIDASQYLLPRTSLVTDAHKEGLEVFASDFSNDVPYSFNFSYDPLAEYLHFIDNGDFSVDGVLSDFPITPSAAIDCFSHLGRNASNQVDLKVISKNGASGDFPSCTNLAYQQAISDGADVIDSAISNPFTDYKLFRNPKFRNSGNFLKLSDFLALAKNSTTLSGVLISIENAAYLAEKQGLGVTDAVMTALKDGGYDNQTDLKVMIQSTNSSVLMKFKDNDKYEIVYKIEESIRDASNATVEDIKKFADSVVVNKVSVFPVNAAFITGLTDVVAKLQAFKLPVYVELFSNEFISQAWDFFSDATMEINSFVSGTGISGVITDFPKTASRYRKNRCSSKDLKTTPNYMSPVQPGSLIQLVTAQDLQPAEAPNPILTESDIAEPPLSPVAEKAPSSPGGGSAAAPTPPPNGQPKLAACIFLSSLAMLLALLLF